MGSEATAESRRSGTRALDIRARLSELSAAFAANLVAATHDFSKLASESELAGLPARDLAGARRRARDRGQDGCLLTIDPRSFRAALQGLHDRALRKALYEAYTTRASDRGPCSGRFDNTPILSEMLELRHELAVLHGFANFAELALTDGVIPVPDEAERYLLGYHQGTKARARAALDQLWAFAKEQGVPRGFSNWDLPYYAAQWSRDELGLDEAEVRAHFGLERTVAGVRGLAERLLGLQIVPLEPGSAAERFGFRVSDAGGNLLGELDLDVFGPDDVLREPGVRLFPGPSADLAIARVQCGFEPPEPGARVLLSHAEVELLFSGVGRGLYLLATRTQPGTTTDSRLSDLGSHVAGSFFERFAQDFGVLSSFARHADSGDELSRALFDKLACERSAHGPVYTSHALELSLFDLRIHRDHIPSGKSTQLRVQVLDTLTQIRREQSVLPASYWTRFANSMTSIFAGDFAAKLWELDWAREQADRLFQAHQASGCSGASARRICDTWFAPGARELNARLASALVL